MAHSCESATLQTPSPISFKRRCPPGRRALQSAGVRLNSLEVSAVIGALDVDLDGRIDYCELAQGIQHFGTQNAVANGTAGSLWPLACSQRPRPLAYGP